MSSHSSLAMGADCSHQCYSASDASALLNTEHTQERCSLSVKEMELSQTFQSSVTSEHLMADPTAEELDSYLEDFPARSTALPLLDETTLKTFGRRCGESWQMLLPGTSSPKTFRKSQSNMPQKTVGLWVTGPKPFPLERLTWVVTTFGKDIGYLHTPTTKANYAAQSMQKWPSARAFVMAFGRPSPENQEWLMGWPEGWSDSSPLEMAKFQSWLRQHWCFSRSHNESA
ncbi:hypothetical protein PCP56_27945 [Pseudomonas aeruginosa]|nr:hypothetical protein [Pseudomonas aeruginosa]